MVDQQLSPQKQQQYRRVFEDFDLNSDGQIDADELEKAVTKLGMSASKDEVKAMIKVVDKDNSGTMNFPEFCDMMERRQIHRKKDDHMREIFKSVDTNGDGFISPEELKGLMCKYNPQMTVKDMEEIIEGVDKDKDGKLNYEEFLVLARGHS
ncbi:unnamed protein product [Calicophoron daubneyi]|uniref:EF-hand domain-containing protein n=1 Tax=Calicophoron daubneyi TaxID=300641 RepID=A0AAV2T9F4_CALDB